MPLEVTFFFPPFFKFFCRLIYARLCGSVALVLQWGEKKDKVTQRDGMKRLFEVIWNAKLLQLRAWTQMFSSPFVWIPPLFLDAAGNEDVEMESQNPGTAPSPGLQQGQRVWLRVILSAQRRGGVHIDLTLISGGDRNSAGWVTRQPVALVFTPARVWLKICRDQSC